MRALPPSVLARLAPLLLLAAACGDGVPEASGSRTPGGAPPRAVQEPPQGPPRPEAPASGAADAAPDAPGTASAQGPADGDALERPAPPARVFNSRYQPYGPWWDELVARLDPKHPSDPWSTEVVANLARRVLAGGIEEAARGSTAGFAPLLGERLEAPAALVPPEPETLFDDGALRVRAGAPPPREPSTAPAAEVVEELLGPLVAPYRDGPPPRVEVWVTGSFAAPDGTFETHAHARLSGASPGGGRRQTNATLVAVWRVGSKRVVLERLSGVHYEHVEAARAPFAELTAHVLGGAAEPGGWIWDGAVERAERSDNLLPFTDVYLGMHGMAVGDLDGDGLEDLYVARKGGQPNALLRHLPDGRVQDVAPEAGVDFLDDTAGVLIVDLDGDGARDLALAVGSDVVLCWNDGTGRFPERERLVRPVKDKVYTLVAGDADGDGDLDLYDTRYFTGDYGGGVPTPYHDAHNGGRNSFWRNAGGRVFREDTAAAGLDVANDRFSLAALWEDVDDDGDLDLYVVNDFGRNNLYRNEYGRFRDVAEELGLVDMAAGMGVSCADADLDGDLDLYVSNMFTAAGSRITASPRFMPSAPLDVRRGYQRHTRGNTLLWNRGDGVFVETGGGGEAGPGGWTWGAVFADLDNDRLPDVVVPNGFLTAREPRDLEAFFWRCVVNASPVEPPASTAYEDAWRAITRLSQSMGFSWNGHERNYAYWNVGGGRFVDASAAAALDVEDDTRVASPVDWDGDGGLDLWLRNRTGPMLRLLRNAHPSRGHWIAFELAGRAPNPEAIGALVEIEAAGVRTRRRVYAGEGYLGGPSRRLHFGLGSAETVERVTVRWPDGSRSEHVELAAGALYRIEQGHERAAVLARPDANVLDAAPAGELPSRVGVPDARVVALERVPYGALPLPRFGAQPGQVAEHAGRCLYVYVWASWDDAAVGGLARLARHAAELEEAGLAVHPIALDGPRHDALAHELARDSGLTEPGGRADRRIATLIELGLHAVLPAYDDLPLPVGLFFDPRGRLSVVTVGEIDPARLAADARALAAPNAADGGRWTTALTGGRWIDAGPERDLDKAIEFLRHDRGEGELADELQAFVDARAQEREESADPEER